MRVIWNKTGPVDESQYLHCRMEDSKDVVIEICTESISAHNL